MKRRRRIGAVLASPRRGKVSHHPPWPLVNRGVVVARLEPLRIENLQAVLVPHTWYEVNFPVAGIDAEGQPTREIQRKHFLLLNSASSKGRPKLMPTIASHSDVVVTAKYALNIQELAIKEVDGIEEGSLVAFEDAEARWVSWDDIAPWPQMRSTLSHFLVTKPLVDQPGCVELSGREFAKPIHAINDKRCPTLTILYALYDMGWTAIEGPVTHETVAIGNMHGRKAISMKSYYIVLVEIERCKPLTSRIPSDQPILFLRFVVGREVRGAQSRAQALLGYHAGPRRASPAAALADEEDFIMSILCCHCV